MLRWLCTRLSSWLARSQAEPSRLIVGSTGSGKSEGELVDLVRLARRRDHAVVLLDGHGPLAFRAAGHWAARGYEPRLVYEPLHATDRVLCWSMLPLAVSANLSERRLQQDETRDDVAQCFMAQRNLSTLTDRAWTKEWLEAAIGLCLAQLQPEPLSSLLHAFRVGTVEYERLVAGCENPEITDKFRRMEVLKRRSEVQSERETGPARRLLESVCASEVVRLRSRPGPFDWLQAMQERRLIIFDGGGIRSREIKRTVFSLVTLQVIQAVRRHFASTQTPLPVILVLEEAGALDLVTPFVLNALQELRKAGLAVHIITQSSLDFADSDQFEALLSHTPWQTWYQCLSPADQEIGAKALANATFDPLAVHFTRTRQIHAGAYPAATESRGNVTDAGSGSQRHEQRTGTTYLSTYRQVTDAYFKTPQLHEQEFKTKLATLRIGERLVRDRGEVRRERVRPVRSPWMHRVSDRSTREAIDRIRQQPIYLPGIPHDPAPAPQVFLDASGYLREQGN